MASPQVPHDELHLERFLPYRLSVLANTVSAAIAASYVSRFDLTPPEWRVIAVLAREPGLSAVEVADRTAMDKVAVSRAVARLLRSRRIRRRQASGDRRRSRLELSSAGVALYEQVAPQALRYERELLAALGGDERRQLDSILARLLETARQLGAESAQ